MSRTPDASPISIMQNAPIRGACRACGASLLWAIGANGKRLPLNAEPDPNGNIWISGDGLAHYRSKANPIPEGADRYTSHFSDCPNAQQFRRR